MIRFGTGGWRDVIGENFTFENVRIFSQGIANILIEEGKEGEGIVLGYDNRFMAEEFAKASAEVFAGNKIKVILLTPSVPTPLVNFVTKHEKTAAGLTFTASHNPYIYNGIKYVHEGGMPATEDITMYLEEIINQINISEIHKKSYEKAFEEGYISRTSYTNEFIDFIEDQLDMELLRKSDIWVLYDSMHGTGVNSLLTMLIDARLNVKNIHDKIDPLFGGRTPAPDENTLWRLMGMMKEGSYDIGIATDGDADRIAIVDEDGSYVDANEILVILYYYLLEYKNYRGSVVRNISTTHLLDQIAEEYGYNCYEKPVGFKHIANGMLETEAILGGESSGGITIRGHLLEKDAILSAGILLEMLAHTGKSLKEIRNEINFRFGKRYFQEHNYSFENEKKEQLQEVISKINPKDIYSQNLVNYKDFDGYKWEWDDGTWCLVRFSGTEPVLRITAESFSEINMGKTINRIIEVIEYSLVN